jgi:hypothetical protein
VTEDLVAHMDRLMRQRPASRTALGPFRELVRLMVRSTPDVSAVHVETGMSDIQQQEGFPLFSRGDLPLDFDAASDLLKKFLVHLLDTGRDDAEGMKMALKKAEADDEWPGRLFRAILEQDEAALSGLAKGAQLDPNVLLFLGKTTP